MANHTSHKISFLVSLFLMSKTSLKYVTQASQCCILRYIADAIDFEYKLSKEKAISLSRKQIAYYSRCSEFTVKNAIKHFVKKRILKRTLKPGWHSIYEPGSLLIAYAQRKLKLSTGRVISDRESGYGNPTSNTLSNIKDNNKGDFKKIKKNTAIQQREMSKILTNLTGKKRIKNI